MTNMGMASVRKVHPLFLLGVCHKSGQGRRIKLRCPPKVLTGTLHPSLPSIFSG